MNLCLIGAGRMGRLRAPHFAANQRVTLVAVVDSWQAGGEALASQYESAIYYATLQDAIKNNTSINAVWISTPTDQHAELITLAAANGLPIFTEKPVAEDAVEIAALFKIANQSTVPLCCGFQRRFDDSYKACTDSVQSGKIGTPTMSNVFFGDHPVPPLEFLKNGGCPFMDLSPHDVDYVRNTLGQEPTEIFASGCSSTPELAEANVLDNAFMFVKFDGGTMVTLQMSRGATYGYDQRCEFFGDLGAATVGNQNKTSDGRSDQHGYHTPVLKHSFPERFHQAFSAEVAAFAEVVLDGAIWPVTCKDCVIVQSIARCAAESQKKGIVIQFEMPLQYRTSTSNTAATATEVSHSISMRPIGAGSFGTFIRRLITTNISSNTLAFLPSFTRSSELTWIENVLEDRSIDAVYVASPDAYHQQHAKECLLAGKHVLCEKPITPDFTVLLDVLKANHNTQAFMVGFQRRFAKEFVRAKKNIENSTTLPSEILIESFDPVDACTDMPFVVNNSMCHDVDMLSWMLPCDDKTTTVQWSGGKVTAEKSTVILTGVMTIGDSIINVVLSYTKCYASYVQRVTIDGRVYGYNYTPKENESECVVYNDAYVSQFNSFVNCVNKKKGLKIAGMDMKYESDQDEMKRLESYARTFRWLKEAHDVLF